MIGGHTMNHEGPNLRWFRMLAGWKLCWEVMLDVELFLTVSVQSMLQKKSSRWLLMSRTPMETEEKLIFFIYQIKNGSQSYHERWFAEKVCWFIVFSLFCVGSLSVLSFHPWTHGYEDDFCLSVKFVTNPISELSFFVLTVVQLP